MPKEPVAAAAYVRAQVDASMPVIFRDRMFRSRTFVFVDGSTAPVVNSRITVTLAQQIAEIERHTDFERLSDDAGDAR
ncbi:hypothetical protein [Burkholderia sp. 9120]|uniref:hypothetical protein n=1 Tax=Burkholderia sp. 9120 TaxID=1500897 RepID=UPI00055283B5|nr:hypothetical protein [Burkholderia sp. 9120]